VLRLLGAVATSRDDWRETRDKRERAHTRRTKTQLLLSLSSYLAIVSPLLVLSLLFASNDDDDDDDDGSKL